MALHVVNVTQSSFKLTNITQKHFSPFFDTFSNHDIDNVVDSDDFGVIDSDINVEVIDGGDVDQFK